MVAKNWTVVETPPEPPVAWVQPPPVEAQEKTKEIQQESSEEWEENPKTGLTSAIRNGLKPLTGALVLKSQRKHRVSYGFGEMIGRGVVGATINMKRPVDRKVVDKAITDLVNAVGKDGAYSGQTFDYDINKGVKMTLKDGTPAYANGKINQNLNSGQVKKISKLPENVKGLQKDIAAEKQLTPQQEPSLTP